MAEENENVDDLVQDDAVQDEADEQEAEDLDTEARVPVDILNPATCPKKLREKYTDAERAALRQLVIDGKITVENRDVTILAKSSGTGKDEVWPFVAYIPKTAAEAIALSNNLTRPKPEYKKEELAKMSPAQKKVAETQGLVDYWAYGFYLQVTQPIRNMLSLKAGGPEKEIAKQVKQFMKSGLFESDVEAREAVIRQRDKKAAAAAEVVA